MALVVKRNLTHILPYIKTPFSGSGGTGPYTYSVEIGGAGGTIDSLTGLYTAPSETGIDTIKVVDSLAEESTATINIVTPIGEVCHIIESELGLSNGQVYIYNQKYNIPKDDLLYVAVGILSCKPFSSSNKFDPTTNKSIQSTNFKASLSIDIFSKSFKALEQKELVLMSLNGDYSNRMQEANNFSIGKLTSSFVNLSQEDGPRIPFHFNLTVNIQYAVKRTPDAEYYNTFQESELNINK